MLSVAPLKKSMPEKRVMLNSEQFISVIIPVYNEEDNLLPMLEELEAYLHRHLQDYEIIFINDASTDNSESILNRLKMINPRVRVVHHSKNCGESAAQSTGFKLARAEVLLTMDADMQNDPADIHKLLSGLGPTVDCVCGVRQKRNDTRVKQISSWAANRFRNFVTGDQVADAGCTFRVMRRNALQEIPAFNGLHRFLPTILRLQGCQVVEVLIKDRPRAAGISKYGVGNRLWRGILDCMAMRWYARRVIPGRRTTKPQILRAPER